MPSWRKQASEARFGSSQRRRRRVRRRRIILAVAGIAFAFVGYGVFQVVGAVRDARAGEDLLAQLQDDTTPGELLRGEVDDVLRDAEGRFASANRRVQSPFVTPLRWLPVVGRQVKYLGTMTNVVADVLSFGIDSLDEVQATLDGPASTGPERVEMVRRLKETLATAGFGIRAANLSAPAAPLIQSLDDARRELRTRVTELADGLSNGFVVASGLEQFLTGPRRYLVLGANNAEMQSGWGIPLTAGVLSVNDGELSLPEMQSTADLRLDPPGVPQYNDFEANWGAFNPNEEWRNLALTPRFDQAAPLAAQMWPEATGEDPVDGVMALDPYALRALLAATGPVEVDGQSIGAENVVEYTLNEQYSDQTLIGRSDRQDRLSDIALAAVEAFSAGDLDMVALAENMLEVAGGRHLLSWSSLDADQTAWEAGGIDGALDEDSLLLGIINRGANKLDWFVDVEASLEFDPSADGSVATLTVEVFNRTPPGEPAYVAGPYLPSGAANYGDHVVFVTANLPVDASNASMDGVDGLVVAGPDGPTRLIGGEVIVPRASSAEVVFQFEIPSGRASLRIEPTARARPVRWQVGPLQWRDGKSHTIRTLRAA